MTQEEGFMAYSLTAEEFGQLDAFWEDHGLGLLAKGRTLFCFCSGSLEFERVIAEIAKRCADSSLISCTTCGELGPRGITKGGIALAVLPAGIPSGTAVIEGLGEFRFEQGAGLVDRACAELGITRDELNANPDEFVFVTLCDGLSGKEELLVAALGVYAPQVSLVGGSAGDDFLFQGTYVGVGARAFPGGASVTLLRPGRAFQPFYAHHYRRGERSYVVTDADPGRRLVMGLDGGGIRRPLEEILGTSWAEIYADGDEYIRAHPVVFGFQAAGQTHLRSVMHLEENALLMGGAVEEGAILTAMHAGELVRHTREQLDGLRASFGEVEGALLFNCGGRLWEAEQDGVIEELSLAMEALRASGFTTYGEQFGPLQVNHSLTGLLLGKLQ